jgi:transposase InsO family protein
LSGGTFTYTHYTFESSLAVSNFSIRSVPGEEILTILGTMLLERHDKDLDLGRRHFERALRKKGDYVPAMIGMARVAEELGDDETAMNWFSRAIDREKEGGIALYFAGRHHLRRYLEAVQQMPERTDILLSLVWLSAWVGNEAGALGFLKMRANWLAGREKQVVSFVDVRSVAHRWLETYNETRPHDALGRVPPSVFRRRLELADMAKVSTLAWSI